MIRQENYNLTGRNTFRMKVKCALYIEIEAEEELSALDWDALLQPVMVMGGGSNLLFTKDFLGTVLHVGICHSERSEESLSPQLIRDTIISIRNPKLPDPAVTRKRNAAGNNRPGKPGDSGN